MDHDRQTGEVQYKHTGPFEDVCVICVVLETLPFHCGSGDCKSNFGSRVIKYSVAVNLLSFPGVAVQGVGPQEYTLIKMKVVEPYPAKFKTKVFYSR